MGLMAHKVLKCNVTQSRTPPRHCTFLPNPVKFPPVQDFPGFSQINGFSHWFLVFKDQWLSMTWTKFAFSAFKQSDAAAPCSMNKRSIYGWFFFKRYSVCPKTFHPSSVAAVIKRSGAGSIYLLHFILALWQPVLVQKRFLWCTHVGRICCSPSLSIFPFTVHPFPFFQHEGNKLQLKDALNF